MDTYHVVYFPLLFVFGALALLPGCESIRDTLGLNQTGPNEFLVSDTETPDLTIPPDYQLHPPLTEGEKTSQDPVATPPAEKSSQKAQKLLLGEEKPNDKVEKPKKSSTSAVKKKKIVEKDEKLTKDIKTNSQSELYVAQPLTITSDGGEVPPHIKDQDWLETAQGLYEQDVGNIRAENVPHEAGHSLGGVGELFHPVF